MTDIDPKVEEMVNDLREKINKSRYDYFIKSDSGITDEEFDNLYKALLDLETRFPELNHPNSPTQHVGFPIPKEMSRLTGRHHFPMGGISNIYNPEEFIRYTEKNHGELVNAEFRVEMKYDGIAVSLEYRGGNLTQALTRGDGVNGIDVTAKILMINPNLRHSTDIDIMYPDHVFIRGEVYMPKSNLSLAFSEEGCMFSSCRNAASGIMMLDNPGYKLKYLDFVCYEVLDGDTDTIDTWGLVIDDPLINCSRTLFSGSREEVIKFITSPEMATNGLNQCMENIPIDGFVIKSGNKKIAYKFQSSFGTTGIEEVTWNMGKLTGRYNPVLVLSPPLVLDNQTISKVTLHNWKRFTSYGIRQDSSFTIERRAMVSPQVLHHYPGVGDLLREPTHCDTCKSPLVIVNDTHLCCIRCVNKKSKLDPLLSSDEV